MRLGSGGCNSCACSGGPTGNGTGASGAYTWNTPGDAAALGSYKFAIVRLTTELTADIETRAAMNEHRAANDEYVPQQAEFNFPMLGVENSKRCLADGQCQPVGGYSIWSSPFEPVTNSTLNNRHWILAAAHFDSSALFHDLAVGANDGVAGTVALLAATTALAERSALMAALPKRVVIALFNGESFGFVGSRKFIADLKNFTCTKVKSDGSCSEPFKPDLQFQNLSLSLLDGVVELGQIAQHNNTVFMHRQRDGNVQTDNLIASLLASVPGDNSINLANAAPDTPGVPPSSLQSFIKNNAMTPGVVLADHAGAYLNK